MKIKYYDNNQCAYCGTYEIGDIDTPQGWFGLDEEGNKMCDDCKDRQLLEEVKKLKEKQRQAAYNTHRVYDKAKRSAAAKKAWETKRKK